MAEVAIFKRKNCIFSALDLCNRIILYNTKQHVIGERLTQCISDWVNSKKSTSGGYTWIWDMQAWVTVKMKYMFSATQVAQYI